MAMRSIPFLVNKNASTQQLLLELNTYSLFAIRSHRLNMAWQNANPCDGLNFHVQKTICMHALLSFNQTTLSSIKVRPWLPISNNGCAYMRFSRGQSGVYA